MSKAYKTIDFVEPPPPLSQCAPASDDDVMRALAAHDEALDGCGRSIWVGAEPTYTDRSSETPEWLLHALGDDKRQRAERMLARLARAEEGAAIVRSLGRAIRRRADAALEPRSLRTPGRHPGVAWSARSVARRP